VTAEDGHIYEKCAFERYVDVCRSTKAKTFTIPSPMTGERIAIKSLRNKQMENKVAAYLKLNPNKIPDQYASYDSGYDMIDLAADVLDEDFDSILSYDTISLTKLTDAVTKQYNIDAYYWYAEFFGNLNLEHILHLVDHVTDWNSEGLDGDIWIHDIINNINSSYLLETYLKLESHVDISKMFNGFSLKHYAVMETIDLVSGLMEMGWDFNSGVTTKGQYPIHIAVKHGKLDIVKFLCEKIPNLNLYTKDSLSIAQVASIAEKSNIKIKQISDVIKFCEEEVKRRTSRLF
jgi:hypothetical protein